MTRDNVTNALRAAIAPDRIHLDAPLAPLVTFRVGGPADWLVHARSAADVRAAVGVARTARIPWVMLGGGSNVLIADAGIRAIVIRVHGGQVVAVSDRLVRADAGVTINGLTRWTIGRGYAGLEAWAGTPGTVGGAIHGNAHFKGRNIGELIESVELLTSDGESVRVPASDMAFGYDSSRLQQTTEVVLSADFTVGRGDPATLRAVARESLAFRKRTQPLESASAGCVFQNPNPARDAIPDGIPPSAGALVDRAGLKGQREGGARVSPAHGNFIVNEGNATADDIRRLIERCRSEVRRRFGVELRDEIVYLGFA
jgi:UDP-N-acetylmuramate dehydrogenase